MNKQELELRIIEECWEKDNKNIQLIQVDSKDPRRIGYLEFKIWDKLIWAEMTQNFIEYVILEI